MTPVLRRVTAADWPAVWPLWHAVVAPGDTYCYEPTTTSDAARSMWLDDPRGEVWQAERDGRVLGIYRISPNQAGAGSHVANGSYMVDAAVRGAGVGRALVQHSLERTAAAGYLGMQFNAVAATNVGAIALYADLGFDVVGRVPGAFRHPTEGRVDLLVMYREL